MVRVQALHRLNILLNASQSIDETVQQLLGLVSCQLILHQFDLLADFLGDDQGSIDIALPPTIVRAVELLKPPEQHLVLRLEALPLVLDLRDGDKSVLDQLVADRRLLLLSVDLLVGL